MVKKTASAPMQMPPADFEEDTFLPPPAPGLIERDPDAPDAEYVEAAEHATFLQPWPITPPKADEAQAASRVVKQLPVETTRPLSLFLQMHPGQTPSGLNPVPAADPDPGATLELVPVSTSATQRYPTALPHEKASGSEVAAFTTEKLLAVAPEKTQRFPALAPQALVDAKKLGSSDAAALAQAHFTAEAAAPNLRAASTAEGPVVPILPEVSNRHSAGTRSLPKISLPPPSEDTLPPLPLAQADTLSGRLTQAIGLVRSWRKRRAQIRGLRRELAERISAFERALVQLGELAHAESVEILPLTAYGKTVVSAPIGQRLRQGAELYLGGLHKEQRSLQRKESALASEMRIAGHRRDELYEQLLFFASDKTSGEASSDERYALGSQLSSLDDERRKIASQLGEKRTTLRFLRRHLQILRKQRTSFLYVLSLQYAEKKHRTPHLLLLGAVTERFRPRLDAKKGDRLAAQYSVLDSLRHNVCKVETRLALLDEKRLFWGRYVPFAAMWFVVALALLVVVLLGALLSLYLRH